MPETEDEVTTTTIMIRVSRPVKHKLQLLCDKYGADFYAVANNALRAECNRIEREKEVVLKLDPLLVPTTALIEER